MDIAQLAYRVDSSDLDKANAALDENERAAKRAEGASGRLQRAWNSLQRVTKGLVAAKGLLVAGLTAITVRTARYIQEVALMSQQIGVSTEALSSMRYAAEQMAGVGSGQFDMALRRMTRRITEAAAGGGPAAAAIDAMGLSARELARLSPDEQFRRISDAMRQTGDQGTRLRHVMALMDTEGMPLVNMLSQGADAIREVEGEASELGLTLDRDTIRQAEEFRRTMARMRSMVQGLAIQVATGLLPTLNEFAKLLNSDGFKQGFQTIVTGAVTAAQKLAEFAVTTANVTAFLAEEVAARAHGAAADDIVRLEQEAERIRKQLEFAGSNPRTGAAANWMRDVIGLPTTDELEARLSSLDAMIADYYANPPKPGAGNRGVEDFFNPGAIDFDFDPAALLAGANAADLLAEANERARLSEELLTGQMMRDEEVRLQWLNRIDDMVARAEGPVSVALLNFRRQLAELNAAFAVGEIGIEDYNRATEALGKTLGDVTVEVDTATGKMNAYADQAARNMQTAFADFLFDPFKDGLGGMVDAFGKALQRMAAEMAASEVFKALGGAMSGSDSGWMQALGSFFGGGRRHGGPTRGDRMYRVGEGGEPELLNLGPGRQYLIPGDHGRVEPMSHGGGMAAPMATPQVNINVQGNANVESATARQNQSGGFDVDVILKQVDSYVAQGIATGTGQTGRAMKSRYGLKEQV